MTAGEVERIARAAEGTYRAPEPPPEDGDCEFGPCADCLRAHCPERAEACRMNPRLTNAERSALLAVFGEFEEEG